MGAFDIFLVCRVKPFMCVVCSCVRSDFFRPITKHDTDEDVKIKTSGKK